MQTWHVNTNDITHPLAPRIQDVDPPLVPKHTRNRTQVIKYMKSLHPPTHIYMAVLIPPHKKLNIYPGAVATCSSSICGNNFMKAKTLQNR